MRCTNPPQLYFSTLQQHGSENGKTLVWSLNHSRGLVKSHYITRLRSSVRPGKHRTASHRTRTLRQPESEQRLDMMQFWLENKAIFTKLLQVVRRVLCFPESSAASECVFITASHSYSWSPYINDYVEQLMGIVIALSFISLERRRTTLSSSNVNNVLFLRCWLNRHIV